MKKQLINLEPIKEQIKAKLIEKYNTTTFINTDVVDIKVDIKELLEAHIAEKHLIEPNIFITPGAYVKMRKLVDDTSTEIGWYGIVNKYPGLNEVYVIEDIIVYPQRVTGATCVQDDDKMFEFEMSLTTEQVNHKRFHGHSHVNMGVTPSGVDEQFYQDILSQVNDYFIITITNKRNEYTVKFYDVANNILYSDLPIRVLEDSGNALDIWYEEVKTKLSEPKPIATEKKGSLNCYNTAYREQHKYDPYDEYDYEPDMYWDSRYGYITKAEAELYERKSRRGRPSKKK